MATVKTEAITAEQYRTMPPPEDGSKVELIQGELESMCRPGFLHGLCQVRVGGMLDRYGQSTRRGRAVTETGIVTDRGPDTVRGPDVSFWSVERLPWDVRPLGYPEVAPDLAVEVLSPSNRMARILEKMREYFERGVRVVWVIDPEDRTVTVYRSLNEGRVLHESATLEGEDILPGFACPVAELFA